LRENGIKKMIGVARLIMNPDLTSGEVAVLVHDNFQGKGLGTKFVKVLIEIARERGLEDIRADVLTENENMLKIFQRLGFTARFVAGGTSECVLRLKE
jgi:acetyltransferase